METENQNQSEMAGGGQVPASVQPEMPREPETHKKRGLLSALIILVVVILIGILFFSWVGRRQVWTEEDAAKKQAIVDSISERTTVQLSPAEVKAKEALVKSVAR